ncbi:MAG: tRNA 2-thiocytidine biosynthesis protein TtcA [Clostridia bacterium]|nr:tRNA 2-thiocytidine biosynthesis protein TtcA [Clostridia bacterium]
MYNISMEEKSNIEIERSIIKKFRKDIFAPFVRALKEFEMIEDGDKIAVCISGGKDSMLLAKCMQEIQKHGKQNFELVFLVMNPGYNDKNYQKILYNAKKMELPLTVFETQIFDAVKEIKDSPCYLCARMRRGYLYSHAKKLGCNKIALGHHFNDVIETVLMSILYGAEIKTMMPKVISQNFEGMELIRPLYYVKEDAILKWSKSNGLDFIRCACRFTEAAAQEEIESKRKEMKELIAKLKEKYENIDINILQSTKLVNVDTLIGYKESGKAHEFLDVYNKRKILRKKRQQNDNKNM